MSEAITPLTPTQEAAQEAKIPHENLVVQDLIAVDECVEKVVFDGAPDETMSTAAGIAAADDKGFKKDVGVIVSKGLDIFQRDHGAKAAAGDLARAQEEEQIVDESGIR